jgi:Domain of unknown function (DUF4115)
VPLTRRASRDAALVELQRLHAAILASRARRGVGPDAGLPVATLSRDANAAGQLTRRLQAGAGGTAPARDVPAPTPRSHRRWWLAMGAVAIVGAAGAALMLPQRGKLASEAATSAPDAAPPREAAPAAAPAPPAKAVRVTLETMRPVWMRITVDGVRGFEGELPAGERLAVEGDRDVRVRAGDAGGVRTTLNGVDRGPLGRNGWPLTVSITPEGIQPLTPTRPEP